MKQVEYYKNGNRTLRIKYEGIKKLLQKKGKENEQLQDIMKEVRKVIIEYIEIIENGIDQGAYYVYIGNIQQKLYKCIEILDKTLD